MILAFGGRSSDPLRFIIVAFPGAPRGDHGQRPVDPRGTPPGRLCLKLIRASRN